MEDPVHAEALQAIAGSTPAFLDATAAGRWRRRRCDLFGDVALQAAITAATKRRKPRITYSGGSRRCGLLSIPSAEITTFTRGN